jgi:polyisoprenyl-phosphate glycosyltransferase
VTGNESNFCIQERLVKLISIVTPCYNEEDNVDDTYRQVKDIFDSLGCYRYEHIFIDNDSADHTVSILRRLAAQDRNVKVIVNSRNFGHIRSPHYAMLQARGDALIFVLADRQDPLELIPTFLNRWEEGCKLVMAVKARSQERPIMFALRRAYYTLVRKLADVDLTNNYYGYGILDRVVIEALRTMDDPYPYGRGMIAECGFSPVKIVYTQRRREKGVSKNNFYTLYDNAMLGIISHSKVPLRLATMLGFAASAMSFAIGLGYLVAKLLFWDKFSFGLAPLMIGLFMFASVQLFFIGILGEYIGFIHTLCQRRPLVFERERINFDEEPSGPRANLAGNGSPEVAKPAPSRSAT